MTRNLQKGLAVLVCLIAGSVPGRAQDRFLEESTHRASELLRQGRYRDARAVLSGVLADAERLPKGDGRLPIALNNLANVYQDLGMNADAESCYRRAITLSEEMFGADAPALTRPLQNLATLYLDQGQHAKAEGLERRLLALKAAPGGPAPIDSMRTLHLQAAILHSRRRYADAERLYQQALSFGEKLHTDEAPEATASVLNNLALLYIQSGRPAEAIGPLQRALGVFENAFGQNHPGLVRPLANLAAAYTTLRRAAEAAPLLARALPLAEGEFGTQDPTYGTLLAQYAVALRQMNRKSEAKQYEARARSILATAASRTAAGQTVDVSDLVKPPARR